MTVTVCHWCNSSKHVEPCYAVDMVKVGYTQFCKVCVIFFDHPTRAGGEDGAGTYHPLPRRKVTTTPTTPSFLGGLPG